MTERLTQKELENLFFQDFPQLECLRGSLGEFELLNDEPDFKGLVSEGWTLFNMPEEVTSDV